MLPEQAMADRASSSNRMKRGKAESLFAFPRLLAILAACTIAITPFLPWLGPAAPSEGSPLTLKEATAQLVRFGAISLDLWPFPIVLAVLFKR